MNRIIFVCIVMLVSLQVLSAHCDTLDGPVVKAAQNALDSGNIALILLWVEKSAEPEVKNLFTKVLAVRKINSEVQSLADMYFKETVVRLHRAGEGEPYTGLKSKTVDPLIFAADAAIDSGSTRALNSMIAGKLKASYTAEMKERLEKAFKDVLSTKKYDQNNVTTGRRYVAAYVHFIHYVEEVYSELETNGHHEKSEHEHRK